MTNVVTEDRWEQTGYNDAKNGNAPWVPADANRATRECYLAGYARGVAARQKD